ncbi:MAG: hypothetical protein QOH81_1023 [Sphingomonadales bacterium]|jgi:hypothetical protein|nr:hypothetical protein [Sphingomonadales bacterium]
MKRILISAASALFLLSGCEDGTPEQNVVHVKAANDYSNRLNAMNPMYRNLGLWRAVRDAPQRCKKVDAGAFQQDYRNMAMWTAHCTDTGQWAVFIAPTGEVQVRACADAAVLHLPACRPLPAAAPEPARPKAG